MKGEHHDGPPGMKGEHHDGPGGPGQHDGPDCAALHPGGAAAHVDPPEATLDAGGAEMEASCKAGTSRYERRCNL